MMDLSDPIQICGGLLMAYEWAIDTDSVYDSKGRNLRPDLPKKAANYSSPIFVGAS